MRFNEVGKRNRLEIPRWAKERRDIFQQTQSISVLSIAG